MSRKPSGYWRDWSNIVKELQPIMDQNYGLLPVGKNDIVKNHSLKLAITKYHGGMKSVRQKLGIYDKKYCHYCNRVLPLSSFRIQSKNKGNRLEYYRASRCKECTEKDVKIYRNTDMGIAANICRLTKARAKKHGWDYDLTREWVLDKLNEIGWRCQVTNVLFEKTGKNFFESWTSVSIDRIDPSRGYTRDNVQFVTAWVNKAKSNLSMELFLKFCRDVVQGQSNE